MAASFLQLGILPALVMGLEKENIMIPMEIQEQVIPAVLAGKDLVGQAATGTGKTLAYLLPLFQKIDTAKREVQAMILAPTHELAMQIQHQAERLAANSGLPVRSAALIGQVNIDRQIEKLKDKPQLVIGSAGRILELIQKRKIKAQTIKAIVLDEADRLLDENNIVTVQAVIKTTLRDRQLLFFSATMTTAALASVEKMAKEPQLILLAQTKLTAEVDHLYLLTEQRTKIETLRKLARAFVDQQALVFINKSDQIENVVVKLRYHGLRVAGLYGGAGKQDRQRALEDFRQKKIQLLIASDVAARGLDIPGVPYIINLDLPEEPELYLHRAGRTGRAGEAGFVLSLVVPHEVEILKRYAKVLQINVQPKIFFQGRLINK